MDFLANPIFLSEHLSHFLMLSVGPDGLCAVTHFFNASLFYSQLCCDFKICHFFPELSLPRPSVFGPILDLAASSCYPICCSGSPRLSSSLYKHPLLLAFLLAKMGHSGEEAGEVYYRANLTSPVVGEWFEICYKY